MENRRWGLIPGGGSADERDLMVVRQRLTFLGIGIDNLGDKWGRLDLALLLFRQV